MLALLSPAKKLDFDADWNVENTTTPHFIDETKTLVSVLKNKSPADLQDLMGISDKLAELNYERYQNFKTPFTKDNARPAVKAFQGDTYVGLDAQSLTQKDLDFAQNHIAILSGLYGLLRPLDLMQAYRLEMGTKLNNSKGKNLYDFWGDTLTQFCDDAVTNHKDKTIVCLASNEYIKAIDSRKLNAPFITCDFKEMKNGKPKTIGLFAKKARGMMARYIIHNRIEKHEDLKGFKTDGYAFDAALSNAKRYVFAR